MDEKLRLEILKFINGALRLEHAAAIQYSTHAEMITGLYSGPVISLLKDSAADEVKHADVLRGLIGDYLFGVPALDMALAMPGGSTAEIVNVNLTSEAEAVALYKKILAYLAAARPGIEEVYERLEHDIRHILMEEQEHIAELNRLMR